MIGQLSLKKAFEIEGWMSVRELSLLADIVKDRKIIIEIGTFHGKSARAMADNSIDECKIHCVDPWNYHIMWSNKTFQDVGLTDFGRFYCNLGDHIKKGKVEFHMMEWKDYDPDFKADFIFIDGDHGILSVKYDIYKALAYLSPGGILAGHDYNWPSVKHAVDSIIPNVKVEDTIWIA